MRTRLMLCWTLLLMMTVIPAAAQSDSVTYATAQPYEHGLMIWRSDTGMIWALVNDGRAFSFPAVTYTNLPDNPIFGSPPSRLRPIFGMGKVWGSYPEVRAALGWPTLDELGFDMPVRVTPAVTYLTQLDGTVIQVHRNGTWQRSAANPAPDILDFRAMPHEAGQDVTLSWQIQGVERALIEVYDASGSRFPHQIIQDLPPAGSTVVTIPATFASGARVVLWGVDRGPVRVPVTMWARLVSQELSVSVSGTSSAIMTWAAYQPYDSGFLIWRADTGAVLAFGGGQSGQLLTFAESSYANWPDAASIPIPAGRVRPVNAFGKVWGSIEQVRAMLGYATGGEQGYTMSIRAFAAGAQTFSLPDGRVVQASGSYWNFQSK